MSWARVLATGSGKTGFRLVIEGLGTEFVTDSTMEQTLGDGRVRVVGLKRDGIVLGSGSGIIDGKLKTDGFTAKIADVNESATAAFATAATLTTFATADITTASSSVSVTSTAGWPSSGVLHVGTEACLYSGVTATSFTGLTRAAWSTIAQAHYSALTTASSRRSEVTNRPITVEGRRAYLFAYGEGDDPQGDGTAVFRGVVARDARLDGPAEWSLTIDGMSRVLEQDLVGPPGGGVSPRGIYYPWNSPLYVRLRQKTGANLSDAFDGARNTSVVLTGFYETQDAFCVALKSALDTAMSGWENSIQIISLGSAGWYPVIRSSSTTRWLVATFYSLIDEQYSSAGTGGFRNEAGDEIYAASFATNTNYIMRPLGGVVGSGTTIGGTTPVLSEFLASLGSVPRGTIGDVAIAGADASLASSAPSGRIYLGGDAATALTATAAFTALGGGGASYTPATQQHSFTLDPSQASSAESRVFRSSSLLDVIPFAGASSISMVMSRNVSAASGNGLVGFIQWLLTNSPSFCNLGGTPLLVSDDLNASWQSQIEACQRGRTLARNRRYFAPRSGKLLEYLAEECKLIGCFPALDGNGRIKFVPVQLKAATESLAADMTDADVVTSAQWPGWERSAMGTLNEVVLRTGFNVSEDKHAGTTYNARDVTAYSRSKMPRTLEIAPKSGELWPSDYDPFEDVVDLTSNVLGIFGRPYAVVTLPVPWSRFSVTAGDSVTFDSAQLPANTGIRGISDGQGLVLAKRFAANDAHGVLTLLVHGQNIAGYTPVTRKVSQTNVSGNTWDVTVGVGPIPGYVTSAAFQAGDRVKIYTYDTVSTTTVSGVVVSVAGAVVRVTFDGVWSPGGSTWNLGWDLSTNTAADSRQTAWAFTARSASLINYASGATAPARTYSP